MFGFLRERHGGISINPSMAISQAVWHRSKRVDGAFCNLVSITVASRDLAADIVARVIAVLEVTGENTVSRQIAPEE